MAHFHKPPEWAIWVGFSLIVVLLAIFWTKEAGLLLVFPVIRVAFQTNAKKENDEINRLSC